MDDAPEGKRPATSENIRRVYALPAEMVDRITAFQEEKGLASEVEAVRRLLDMSLKSRDNLQTIVNRLLAHLAHTKVASDAAGAVLIGHPLVEMISFGDDHVSFSLKDAREKDASHATVFENGFVVIDSSEDRWFPKDPMNRYAGGTIDVPF